MSCMTPNGALSSSISRAVIKQQQQQQQQQQQLLLNPAGEHVFLALFLVPLDPLPSNVLRQRCLAYFVRTSPSRLFRLQHRKVAAAAAAAGVLQAAR